MNINWGALGIVFVVALVSVVVLTGLFAVGVVGLSQRESAKEAGASGTGPLAGAVICFTLCAAIVAYGVYLIVA